MPPLTHYFVFGDKFAGVKYVSKILNSTSPFLPLQECEAIHTVNGSIVTDQEKASSWRYGFFTISDLKKNLDCNIDQTLFILTVRDVRSMLCTVAKRKFQTTLKKINNMHINALIVHRWEDDSNLELNGYLDGQTKTKTYNYLKMRTEKSFISFKRFEDYSENPVSELKHIFRGRGLIIGSIEAQNFTNQSGNDGDQRDCFKKFTPNLYAKVQKKLNKRLETKLGYS